MAGGVDIVLLLSVEGEVWHMGAAKDDGGREREGRGSAIQGYEVYVQVEGARECE